MLVYCFLIGSNIVVQPTTFIDSTIVVNLAPIAHIPLNVSIYKAGICDRVSFSEPRF